MHETDGAITSSHAVERSDVGGVEEGAETADIGRKSPPSTETDEMEAGGGEDEEAPVVTADQQPVSDGERVLEDTAYVWGMWWWVVAPSGCALTSCVVPS